MADSSRSSSTAEPSRGGAAAKSRVDAGPAPAGPSLVWPPPDDQLSGWEAVSGAPQTTEATAWPPASVEGASPPPVSAPFSDHPATGRPAVVIYRDTPLGASALPTLPRVRHGEGVAERSGRAQTRADRRRWLLRPAGALLILVVGIFVSLVGKFAWSPGATSATTESTLEALLRVETATPGARVIVDGTARGTTPLSLTLPPGSRMVEVEADGERRALLVELASGSHATYYFDLTSRQVLATGKPSPARRAARSPGVGAAGQSVVASGDRVVPTTGRLGGPALGQGNAVDPGRPTAGGDTAGFGWLVVRSPIDLQVVERDAVVGGSGAGSLRLAAGQHDLLMVSEPFEFRATQRVVVPAGGTVALDVQVPDGVASFNAQPWAEVWVGGQRLGETPLGNVRLPVGHYDVVFKHPQFGERRAVAVVRASTPERVTVSFER